MPVPTSIWTLVRRKLEHVLDRPDPGRDDSATWTRPIEADARDLAIGKLLWSAPLAALALISVYGLSRSARFAPAIELAVPIATALLVPCFVHLVECATNLRFGQLAERWDELRGWQRGLLGTGFALMASLVVLSLAFGAGMHLLRSLEEPAEAPDLESTRPRPAVHAQRPDGAAHPQR